MLVPMMNIRKMGMSVDDGRMTMSMAVLYPALRRPVVIVAVMLIV